ncbi:MAG: DUF924 domain-containing protein [Parachlamydia sp.]|nr:DUF924 domain-containing protein [Parachlamydia sp.]
MINNILAFCLVIGFCCTPLAAEDTRIVEILQFWFGPLKNSEEYAEDRNTLWFSANEVFDAEIRQRYESMIQEASQSLLDWKGTPQGRLGLILLLDQFTRNAYRNTPQAFACDALAQQVALEGIARGDDLQLRPIERCFFYLPLEHAEDLALQELSIAKFDHLVSDLPESQREDYQGYADYAGHHYRIIKRFGRFPHRNAILGRESTQDEVQYLTGSLSSFDK